MPFPQPAPSSARPPAHLTPRTELAAQDANVIREIVWADHGLVRRVHLVEKVLHPAKGAKAVRLA